MEKLSKSEFISQQSRSVRDLLYEYLREAIIEGDYESGKHLRERELAKEFNVSTTPVKEAFRQLEKEGLIKTVARKGSFVSENMRTSIQEIGWARAALEGVAARLAAIKRTDEEIEMLKEIVEKMRKCTENNDAEQLKEYNTEFHDLIRTCSKNDYIDNQVKAVRSYDLFIRRKVLSNYREHETAYKEHFAIFEAIRKQDGDEAEKVMKEHIMRSTEIATQRSKQTTNDE